MGPEPKCPKFVIPQFFLSEEDFVIEQFTLLIAAELALSEMRASSLETASWSLMKCAPPMRMPLTITVLVSPLICVNCAYCWCRMLRSPLCSPQWDTVLMARFFLCLASQEPCSPAPECLGNTLTFSLHFSSPQTNHLMTTRDGDDAWGLHRTFFCLYVAVAFNLCHVTHKGKHFAEGYSL